MLQETEPSQAAIEAAVEATFGGWGAELYVGQKFRWMDWNRKIRDVLTATGAGQERESQRVSDRTVPPPGRSRRDDPAP